MRQGFNPHKDKRHEETHYIHQVIIPVYLPQLEDYYQDGLQILKLCLESLFNTIHDRTYITVANNGSTHEVRSYLEDLFNEGKVHELINTGNCGKLNAILKGLTGHNFPLVTISDADVLFLEGWQQETYKVFEDFPRAGAVCPTPSSRSYKTYTSNIWFDLFFSKRLQFTDVQDSKSLIDFAHSIDYKNLYNEHHLSKYLTVSSKNSRAVVGAGHFVATYRSDVFRQLPKNAKFKMGGDSEVTILDIPVFKYGYWRLSTLNNYAKHMGNVFESWMEDELPANQKYSYFGPAIYTSTSNGRGLLYYLTIKVFSKIISHRFFLKHFLRYKGLSREASQKY